MKKHILFLFLFPILLFSEDRKKQIDLVHDWPVDPNDQGFAKTYLKDIYNTLQEKHVRFLATDLKNEKDTSELTYIVVWNKPGYLKEKTLERFPKKKLLLFMWEPPVYQESKSEYLDHFKRIYTWDDDLVDNKKFFKFYYPVFQAMQKNLPSFEERKLLTQISSNKKSKHPKALYQERESIIQFFEDKPGVFEFYGFEWEPKKYKNYLGTVQNKQDALKNYRFSVCYESMHDVKGYITEKIFDCFAAGTIPIYWGASNITDYIPKNCFIDRRDFHDWAEVYAYIQTMDKATYEAYLQNIRSYLDSDKAKLFSQEMFNVIFLEAIRFP